MAEANLDTFEVDLDATLAESMQDIEFELRNALDDLEEDRAGFIDSNARNVANLDGTVKRLGAIITEQGLDPVLQKQQSILDDLLGTILKAFAKLGIEDAFGGATDTTIQLLLDGADAEITNQFGRAEGAVAQHLRSAMLGGVKRQDLVNKVKVELETTERNAKTALNTSLHAMNRKVTIEHAKELGFNEFGYVGPKDDSNRPFCHRYVNHRGTIAQWEALRTTEGRSKQPLPIMVFGGGYNCRHGWIVIMTPADRKRFKPLPKLKIAA